jgi:hypothetical protein
MAAHSRKVVHHGGGSDSVYGLGMIGAWVYYIGRATTPRLRVLGFLKGLVWPAMLVYEVLKFLNDDLPVAQRLAPVQPAPTLGQAKAQVSKPAVKAKARSARKPARSAKPKTKKAARK